MKPVRIFLFLCSVLTACNMENPVPPVSGDRQRTPVELLHALKTARGVERARTLQQLGLTTEAIAAWDEVVREGSRWSEEARNRRDALMRRPDPLADWNTSSLRSEPQRLARAYPSESMRALLDGGLSDPRTARIVADVLAANGDPYVSEVLAATERPGGEKAIRAYRNALTQKDTRPYEHAAQLLERASNPLHLYARYRVARSRFYNDNVVALLDALIPMTPRHYRMLLSSMYTLRAGALEIQGDYFLAHANYAMALGFAHSPTDRANALSRRSLNYKTIGDAETAFNDAVGSVRLLEHVSDLNTHSTAYASAAEAASELGHHQTALLYRNVIIAIAQKSLRTSHDRPRAAHVLAVAFRARAETHAALGNTAAAETDLGRGRDLAEGLDDVNLLAYLRMRLREVTGDTLLTANPAEAAKRYSEAIEQAAQQDSTFRAALHFKRAAARRNGGDPRADEDVRKAFDILRDEATRFLERKDPGEHEDFLRLYFSRFRTEHRAAIRRSLDAGRTAEAFVQDEQGRAFEPLHVAMQSPSAPADFRPIVTLRDLENSIATIPANTVIVQYLVLSDYTFAWTLRRGHKIEVIRVPVGERQIEEWRRAALHVVKDGKRSTLERPMRAVYAALFRPALMKTSAKGQHLVIVPDGPMHGLPFAALEDVTTGFLLEEVRSIVTDASTTRYLYARARDAQFRQDANPSVLLAAATVFDLNFEKLPAAQQEVDELRNDFYPQARVLSGAEVTAERLLAATRGASVIHFAGHAVAVPRRPWRSHLVLASGELNAKDLMRELAALERTRLVILGACETAGGQPVGPEGLTPLVRPLIAANVPAVVGTLWKVNDATAKELLVSLHCHYRHGDDVAVALREAQLERLREKDPPMSWAPYQVVGYAGSPYPRDPAMEKTPHESVCAQHSLQRPDGLHPQ